MLETQKVTVTLPAALIEELRGVRSVSGVIRRAFYEWIREHPERFERSSRIGRILDWNGDLFRIEGTLAHTERMIRGKKPAAARRIIAAQTKLLREQRAYHEDDEMLRLAIDEQLEAHEKLVPGNPQRSGTRI